MAHISIQHLGVEFAIFGSSSRSLKNTLVAQATGGRVMSGARDIVNVRAIDDLSLEIADGDRIGLVGHNGSGNLYKGKVQGYNNGYHTGTGDGKNGHTD